MQRSKDELRRFNKFKFSPRTNNESLILCQECDNFLVTEPDSKIAKSAKNTWPSFILSTLVDETVISSYGNRGW